MESIEEEATTEATSEETEEAKIKAFEDDSEIEQSSEEDRAIE